jgi:hypothetical protein
MRYALSLICVSSNYYIRKVAGEAGAPRTHFWQLSAQNLSVMRYDLSKWSSSVPPPLRVTELLVEMEQYLLIQSTMVDVYKKHSCFSRPKTLQTSLLEIEAYYNAPHYEYDSKGLSIMKEKKAIVLKTTKET